MTDWTEYVSVTVAVIGVVQAVFLCLLLRSEGVRAFGANRWMMLFIAAVAFNLIEDVAEKFVSVNFDQLLDLFFAPTNFVIAPAIYLYFREISGNPSKSPWVHFILPLIVFNMMAWAISYNGVDPVLWSDGFNIPEMVEAFSWTAIFVQVALYIGVLWRVTCRYFQQTQEQLGADRKVMQRWLAVILGGLTLVFVTVAVGRVIKLYLPENTEMFGTEIAFVIVLFAMCYEIATRPALFVMADWPADSGLETAALRRVASTHTTAQASKPALMPRDANADPSPSPSPSPNPNPNPASEPNAKTVSAIQSPQRDGNDGRDHNDENAVRPLLDEDGVTRAVSVLRDIQRRGDILLDPLVSLPKLARAVGVTPNQLSYVLNHHLGQSFFDFVNAARIQEARAVLLLEPDRTILDIALSVGFNSKSTFNLAFKKITGDTPSAVREAAKSMNGEVRAS